MGGRGDDYVSALRRRLGAWAERGGSEPEGGMPPTDARPPLHALPPRHAPAAPKSCSLRAITAGAMLPAGVPLRAAAAAAAVNAAGAGSLGDEAPAAVVWAPAASAPRGAAAAAAACSAEATASSAVALAAVARSVAPCGGETSALNGADGAPAPALAAAASAGQPRRPGATAAREGDAQLC
jgi:hypothetical protein